MNNFHPATISTVAEINHTKIVIIENGEKRVAIKPICEALGVDMESQRKKIQRDEILSSVALMTKAVGADKKEREMLTLPVQFIFGWLFTIQTERVSPEAREAIIKYKLECYNALWRHFMAYQEFVEYRQQQIDEQLEIVALRRMEFNTAKNDLKEADDNLHMLRKYNFATYMAEKRQMVIEFEQVEIES